MVLYGYLPAHQRQSRDAAKPDATQPDKFEERVLRFVVFLVQLTNIINGMSADTKTWSRKVQMYWHNAQQLHTQYVLSHHLNSLHLSQGDRQLTLQPNDKYYFYTHTHNRPIQTTCWRHITLHVKLQPNALIHSHKTPSLRTTHNCTIAKLPHCLTSRKIRHGCYQLFRWVRSFRHNKQHDARKQEPI